MTSFHELAALTICVREGKVKALSEKSLAWFTYCTSMRPSGLRSTWACPLVPLIVTLSRSEGSVPMALEMLRCPLHDSALTDTNSWINSLKAIIIVAIRW